MLRSRLIIAGIVALFVIQSFIRFRSDIHHDAAWYLYVADGLLYGKHLYTDFLEVNPPLAIWLTLPVVWLEKLTGFGSVNVNFGILLALTGASLFLVNRYLRLMRDVPETSRFLLCAFIAAAVLFMPANDFAEREHLMVLLFLPWPFLRLARARGAHVGLLEGSVVGLMAAIAICIKPQSVLAPLGAELVLLLSYRNLRGLFAPENMAATVFAVLYGAAIFFVEPEFLGTIVSLGVKAYVPFYGYSHEAIWFVGVRSNLLVLLAVLLWRRTEEPMADIAALLAAVAAGFILSYFIQYKGFSYQILPARVFGVLACAAAAFGIAARMPIARWPPFTMFLMGTGALVAAFDFGSQAQTYSGHGKIFDAGIARYAPGARSIFIASTRVSHGFPFTLNRKLVWASRLPAQWLTPYVASKWQGGALPADDDITARALDWTVTDLATFHPDIVFVEDNSIQLYVPGGSFDYVKFWSNDPRFEALWAGYERRAGMDGFAIYTAR